MAITTIGSYTFNQAYTGYVGSIRNVCPITGGAAKQIRCTCTGFNSSNPMTASNISIGVWAGTAADTKATPIELLVGGVSGINYTGTPLVTDWANLTGFTASDMLVCILEQTSGINYYGSVTGSNALIGPSPSYNQATSSGFSSLGAVVYCFTQIDVQAPDTWKTIYNWNMT
jgi:hypothetical protein